MGRAPRTISTEEWQLIQHLRQLPADWQESMQVLTEYFVESCQEGFLDDLGCLSPLDASIEPTSDDWSLAGSMVGERDGGRSDRGTTFRAADFPDSFDDPTRKETSVVAVEADMRAWCAAHPDATLTQIEAALDTGLRAARAGLLAKLAADSTTPGSARCPDCGGPLVRRGDRVRTLPIQGEDRRKSNRPFLNCAACGTWLFPTQ